MSFLGVFSSSLFVAPRIAARLKTNNFFYDRVWRCSTCDCHTHWSASTCKHPHCTLRFAKSRYYLWRHEHVDGKRLASNALLFVALQRHSRKRTHSVCSASVSEALLCGNTSIVTKCSLSRAPICGATKQASWKWSVLFSHWGERGEGAGVE